MDDFSTTLTLVAAGQGVALVPQLGLADLPPGVVLTRLPLRRRTKIAYRSGAGRHPAVAAITAALRSAVPPRAQPAGPAYRQPTASAYRPGRAAIVMISGLASVSGCRSQSPYCSVDVQPRVGQEPGQRARVQEAQRAAAGLRAGPSPGW